MAKATQFIIMKKCIKCNEEKPISEFPYHNEHGKKRVRNVCKVCYRQQVKERKHNKNPKMRYKEDIHNNAHRGDIVAQYLDCCDYKVENIDTISQEKFIRLFKIDYKFDFDKLKQDAYNRLQSMGYCNPQSVTLNEDGKYLIIGDTFGKKTSTAKFQLLSKITQHIDAKAVISIGHNTDDYNDVSNAFSLFELPIYFIPIKNELKDVHNFCCTYMDYNVVLGNVFVGDVIVCNQEHILPYVKNSLNSLDPLVYYGKRIVNCTRHEYVSRTTTYGDDFICSTGAMAEPHVARVTFKLLLANGGRVNMTPVSRDSFTKYRKNDIDKALWECGCIIVTVKNGKTTVEMVRIKVDDNNNVSCVLQDGTYFASNFETKHLQPKYAVLSDIHAPYEDNTAINKCIAFMNTNKPEKILINGDFMDCRSMNPHNSYTAQQCDFNDELDKSVELLKRLSEVAETTVLYGNHEDFMRRFFEQHPQLITFFNSAVINKLSQYANVLPCNRNAVIPILNGLKALHGSSLLFGVNGSYIDKVARGVGRNSIKGHTHSAATRFGVYCSGCLCDLDQDYNNAITSNWNHSFLLVFEENGDTFIHHVFL